MARGVHDIVSAMSLRAVSVRSAILASLVLGAGLSVGCSSSGPSRPAGFSTAYAPPGYDAAVAPRTGADAEADAGAEPDGGAPEAGVPPIGPPILRSIAGSGAGSAWAVGDDGAAVHLTGNTFTPSDTGAGVSLGGLNVLDVSHAFAVERGGPRVFAWTGDRTWAQLGEARADRAAAATWAASSKDVWVVGNGVERWNGTTWTQEVPAGKAFTSIAGSFDTDVWAVGPGGAQHWNGELWTAAPVPANTPPLAAVWVGGLYDAWVVGAAGTVLHWTGSAFTAVVPPTTEDLTAITGTGTFDIWIGGRNGLLLHWDGNSWTQLTSPSGRTIESVWTSVGGDVFFVDGAPTITRFAR
jgi:hypothetical protein